MCDVIFVSAIATFHISHPSRTHTELSGVHVFSLQCSGFPRECHNLWRAPHLNTSLPSLLLSYSLTCTTLPQRFLLGFLCKPCVSRWILLCCPCVHVYSHLISHTLFHVFHTQCGQPAVLPEVFPEADLPWTPQVVSWWPQGCASKATLTGQPGLPITVVACTLLLMTYLEAPLLYYSGCYCACLTSHLGGPNRT